MFFCQAKEASADEWEQIGSYLTQMTNKYNQLNNNCTIPQLDTFEQLLTTIDDETKENDKDTSITTSTTTKINNNSNKIETTDHKEYKHVCINSYNSNNQFKIDLETVQQCMNKMNHAIEQSLDQQEDMFSALFKSYPIGRYRDSYLITNLIINLLQTCFNKDDDSDFNEFMDIGKNENDSQFFAVGTPKLRQINLKCAQLILDNTNVLKQEIDSIVETESDLHSYFSRYKHQFDYNNIVCDNEFHCNLSGEFITNILRNLLFEIGVICFIIQHLYIAKKEKNENKEFEHRYTIDQVDRTIKQCLNLQLLDTMIRKDNISIYHILTKDNEYDLLKTLLTYDENEWSVVKDGTGQVEQHFCMPVLCFFLFCLRCVFLF